jgi:hypothetical protein
MLLEQPILRNVSWCCRGTALPAKDTKGHEGSELWIFPMFREPALSTTKSALDCNAFKSLEQIELIKLGGASNKKGKL